MTLKKLTKRKPIEILFTNIEQVEEAMDYGVITKDEPIDFLQHLRGGQFPIAIEGFTWTDALFQPLYERTFLENDDKIDLVNFNRLISWELLKQIVLLCGLNEMSLKGLQKELNR